MHAKVKDDNLDAEKNEGREIGNPGGASRLFVGFCLRGDFRWMQYYT